MAARQQARQQAIQDLQFARQPHSRRQSTVCKAQLRPSLVQVTQQGVIADVAQLHDGVVDALHPLGKGAAGCAGEQSCQG